jgi:predicted dehydrogenase
VEYHDLLAQPGVDAVVIASPDHQHAPMLYAALDAKQIVDSGIPAGSPW